MTRKLLQLAIVLPACILTVLSWLTVRWVGPIPVMRVLKDVSFSLAASMGVVALMFSIFSDPAKESGMMRRCILIGLLAGIVADYCVLGDMLASGFIVEFSKIGVTVFFGWFLAGPLCVAVWNLPTRLRRQDKESNWALEPARHQKVGFILAAAVLGGLLISLLLM